jgi:DNA-binding response OmpR family regulator
VAIHHLRKIIGKGFIEAVRGMGYRFRESLS